MAVNTCVCQPFPSVGGGKQNQNPGQEQAWPQLHSSDVHFLWTTLPVAEEPRLGSGWCYIHRHSNTCLPKVGPLDWGVLLPIQGSFACADNRCDKNTGIRFGQGRRFNRLHSFPKTLGTCYWVSFAIFLLLSRDVRYFIFNSAVTSWTRNRKEI